MMKNTSVLFVWLVWGVGRSLAAEIPADTDADSNSSKLMIHVPHRLYQEGGYRHREALFGISPYGGSIVQNVYYTNSDLCEIDDMSGGFPAREKEGTRMKPYPSPFLLMMDRGHCTFVQKVRNAQHMGASGVLIADNTCICSDTTCTAANPTAPCEMTEPIMADDGSGADISIPSFLLYKTDADKIIAEVKENRPVQAEMAWSLPSPDDRVEYDLWTSPSDGISAEFIRDWKDVAIALGDKAYFTPHMYLHDGEKSGCHAPNGDNYCFTLCTNSGRYCATDPDDDLTKGISGGDVVRESLRRICIWSHYGAANGIGREWWDYVNEFNQRCSAADYFADDACIKDAYKHSKVNGDTVEECMSNSGGTKQDVVNTKLKTEIDLQHQQGVVVIPTAYVNTAVIRGAMQPSTVFTAICAGYLAGTAPAKCTQCSACPDPVGCIRTGKCTSESPAYASTDSGVSTHTFATSMLFVVALFSGLGVWQYKRSREEMRDQVRGILAEYMPLEDQDQMNGKGDDNGSSGMMSNPMGFAQGGSGMSLIS
jgi:hypothetical protein